MTSIHCEKNLTIKWIGRLVVNPLSLQMSFYSKTVYTEVDASDKMWLFRIVMNTVFTKLARFLKSIFDVNQGIWHMD